TTRSHFDAQDYMESGTPGVKSTPDGWLARALRARSKSTSPFRAVAMGGALPRTLQGDVGAISMQSIDRFDVRAGADTSARQGFEALYEQGVRDLLHGTGRETFEAVKMLRSANASRISPANGAEYPRGPFGEALRQIAQLIKANVGLEVAFADMPGWDTHVAQGAERGQLALRFREFGGALAAFARDLGDKMADVVVITMSEFGRTVAENGNRGTDHGHATAMLVLGGGVRGGRAYGRWPGLAPQQLFEGRDLAVTTDFRSLLTDLAAAFAELRDDGATRVVIVTGAPPVFSAGADAGLKSGMSAEERRAAFGQRKSQFRRLFERANTLLESLEQATIAMINGHA